MKNVKDQQCEQGNRNQKGRTETCTQWCSRSCGCQVQWSNLPPFHLRFWKLESCL